MEVDCRHNLRLCGDIMKMSLPENFETPTSPWVLFRVEFLPLGWLFHQSCPPSLFPVFGSSAGWVSTYLVVHADNKLFSKFYILTTNCFQSFTCWQQIVFKVLHADNKLFSKFYMLTTNCFQSFTCWQQIVQSFTCWQQIVFKVLHADNKLFSKFYMLITNCFQNV